MTYHNFNFQVIQESKTFCKYFLTLRNNIAIYHTFQYHVIFVISYLYKKRKIKEILKRGTVTTILDQTERVELLSKSAKQYSYEAQIINSMLQRLAPNYHSIFQDSMWKI